MSKADVKNKNLHYICKTLTEKPVTHIIRDLQPKSLSERYRHYKNPLRYDFTLENPYLFMQLQNRSRNREIQERFKREKNNANLNNLGKPPEKAVNERVSPLIEEESSRPSSINTSLLKIMVDQKW